MYGHIYKMKCIYLVEIFQSLVEIGQHSCGGFIGDFDGRLQNALGDNVASPVCGWLSRYVDSVVLVAAHTVLLQLLV